MAAETRFIRLNLETNLTIEEISSMLPKIAAQAGVQVSQTFNPILHIGVKGMENDQTSNSQTVTVGNLSNSTVGAIGSARDVSLYLERVQNSSLPESMKLELSQAREMLEECNLDEDDKRDAAEDLDKLTAELQKGEAAQSPSKVSRYLNRIKEVAPTAAAVLSIAASIAKLAG